MFKKYLKSGEQEKVGAMARGDLRLEPLKLPSFSGNVRNYPQFKNYFAKLISPRRVTKKLALMS